MQFVFIPAIVLSEVSLIDFLKVMEIVGALRVYAFVHDEMFPVFLWNKGIAAMRAAQLHGRKAAFCRGKPGGTDFAEYLAFGTVVFIKEWLWGITAGAGAFIWDVTLRAAADGADFLAIVFFVVWDKFLISPVLTEVGDQREFINSELLVFGGMGIVKSPLLERDISADEVNQPAVLLVKILNYRE